MKIFTYVMLISFISFISAKAQTTILSNQDFASGTLPTGWSSTKNSQAVGWQFGDYTQAVETYDGNTYFAPTANGEMAFDMDLNNNDLNGYATEDRLITLAFDLSSYTIVRLNFQAYFLQYYASTGSDTERLTCEASTDGGNTWTVLESVIGNPYWQDISVNADAFAGKSNVEFCFHYNDGGTELVGAAFTNVSVTGWSASFAPQHSVVFEESSGMWCGFCVRGIVYQDSLEKVYPNSAITITVHDNDALSEFSGATETYDADNSSFPGFNGYPNDVVDRVSLVDPSLAFSQYNDHINDFCPADITVSPSYNDTTRNATIDVSGHFAVALNGSYSYALVLTEDSVMGNSDSYDQSNYYSNAYSNGEFGQMGIFNSLPEQVPYYDMYYMFVARDILGSYTGTSGSLPSTIAANSTQKYTFNYTVPGSCNAARMKAIALLLDGSSGDVLNANYAYLIPRSISTGISVLNTGITDAAVYPNPFNDNLNLSINLTKSEHVMVVLSDILGRTITINDEGNLASGEHNFVYNASALASGIYLMTIKTEDGQLTRKIVKQ
jgi:hypothetical protein